MPTNRLGREFKSEPTVRRMGLLIGEACEFYSKCESVSEGDPCEDISRKPRMLVTLERTAQETCDGESLVIAGDWADPCIFGVWGMRPVSAATRPRRPRYAFQICLQ